MTKMTTAEKFALGLVNGAPTDRALSAALNTAVGITPNFILFADGSAITEDFGSVGSAEPAAR
jgi:hypothetical protein